MYNDFYDTIDKNLSDSNVGGRKNRNIRDNLFIVYGIINNAIQNNLEVDLNFYDVAKCFDAQWHAETMNDMWNVGVNNDKFSLMSKLNKKCNIAIKTPAGMTERFSLEEIEMQGTVTGPIKATVQIDSLGRDCYVRREGIYTYNDCVSVPPLSMCDDVASFSLCGVESVMTNAIINAMIESKKLEFGPSKCYNLHIGKNKHFCQDLKVHKDVMNKKQFETYLGDVVSNDATNDLNVEKRRNNGIGAVSQIMSTVSQVMLGHYHFEVALIMHDAILISKMIYSSEIWYNITKQQYSKLETIDEMFMRKLLDLPSSAPRISLYNECGKTPIKYLIKARRLMFYWHVLQLNSDELVFRFYTAQKLRSVKNDWVLQIDRDKTDIGLKNMSDEEIRQISKQKFKSFVKKKINEMKCKEFKEIQSKQSKTKNLVIRNSDLPAKYLLSKQLCVKEVQTLFKLKTRMINVKDNCKTSYKENMWCKTCLLFSETQEHLFLCSGIRKHLKNIKFDNYCYNMLDRNLVEQEKFAKIYTLILETRTDMLNQTEK